MKKILLGVLVSLCVMSLSASPLEMLGYGKTEESARSDAKTNLVKYLMGEEVVAATSTETQASTDGKSSESHYSSESASLAYGTLLGVKYTEPVRDKKQYKVTAYIDEESLPIFLKKLETLSHDIDSLYKKVSSPTQGNQDYYEELMAWLHDYEAYCHIAYMLGALSEDIPALKNNITYNSVRMDYTAFLIADETRMETEARSLGFKSAEYASLMAQIERNREEQKRNKSDAERLRQEERQKQDLRVQKMVESIKGIGDADDGKEVATDDFLESMLSLYNSRWRLESLESKRDNLIAAETERIDKMSEAEQKALRNTPYRLAEMRLDGTPLPKEEEKRSAAIAAIKSYYDGQKADLESKIREATQEEIASSQKEVDDKTQAVEETTFFMPVDDLLWDEKSKLSIEYDGENRKWLVTLIGNPLGSPSFDSKIKFYKLDAFQFYLPYKTVAGSKAKGAGGEAYKDSVEALDKLLKSNRAFIKGLRFHIVFKPNHTFDIKYDEICFSGFPSIEEENFKYLQYESWDAVEKIDPSFFRKAVEELEERPLEGLIWSVQTEFVCGFRIYGKDSSDPAAKGSPFLVPGLNAGVRFGFLDGYTDIYWGAVCKFLFPFSNPGFSWWNLGLRWSQSIEFDSMPFSAHSRIFLEVTGSATDMGCALGLEFHPNNRWTFELATPLMFAIGKSIYFGVSIGLSYSGEF